jgi:hypothetical protein
VMMATMANRASRRRRVEDRAHGLASLAVRFCAMRAGIRWLQEAGSPGASDAEVWCVTASGRCPDSAGKTLSKESELIPPHNCTGVLKLRVSEGNQISPAGLFKIRLQSTLLNCNRICYLLLFAVYQGSRTSKREFWNHEHHRHLKVTTLNISRIPKVGQSPDGRIQWNPGCMLNCPCTDHPRPV